MSGNRQKTGKFGEEKALYYLIEKNYQIIETNWRHQKCEIDIIASKNKELVFVEVKTRTNPIVSQENLISVAQQKRIIYAADYYINKNKIDSIGIKKGNLKFVVISGIAIKSTPSSLVVFSIHSCTISHALFVSSSRTWHTN